MKWGIRATVAFIVWQSVAIGTAAAQGACRAPPAQRLTPTSCRRSSLPHNGAPRTSNTPRSISRLSRGTDIQATGHHPDRAVGNPDGRPGNQSTHSSPYTSFSMRSVSALNGNAFADPAVAVNINGVYLANPTVMHGLFYDLDRIEILKGPHGTLYGRNATAGAINIIPNRPSFTPGGNAFVDVGDYDRFNFGAVLNAPGVGYRGLSYRRAAGPPRRLHE